jgi:putative NADH-flavin reductase
MTAFRVLDNAGGLFWIDAQGNSRISFADYAIALVDELENAQHRRARFTIGY